MIREILVLQLMIVVTISLVGQTRQDSTSEQELLKKEFKISSLEKIDYQLPKDFEKLKPIQNDFKIQIGLQRHQYNIWRNTYNFDPQYTANQSVQTYRGYFEKPQFLQIDLAYQIKPWIKAGVLTHSRNKLTGNSSLRGENISAYLELEMEFKRTWGLFVEYSPLPVKYLRLRRWEINLGASINSENIAIRQPINGSYRFDVMDWRSFKQEKEQTFSLISSQFYGGFRIYLLPFLSMNAKVGYYYIPPFKLDSYTINIPDPLPNLDISPEPFKLSYHFYSLGLNLHL